jgi:hypothetical protein
VKESVQASDVSGRERGKHSSVGDENDQQSPGGETACEHVDVAQGRHSEPV